MKKVTFYTCVLAFASLVLLSCDKKVELLPDELKLVQKYDHIHIIDAHNHDASGRKYKKSMTTWNQFGIDQIVLFGDASEPSAVVSDNISWNAFNEYPERIIPLFSGFDIQSEECLDDVTGRLENGFFGIGEFVAASTYSPVVSNVPWKGKHPMDAFFPQVYEICEAYKAPLLLHIDPPNGFPVEKLEEALEAYPSVNIIFAHANAYNSTSNIRALLEKHDNLYIDFFVGFTYNPDAKDNGLRGYSTLIEEFPNKFVISTDGGFDIGYRKAYMAFFALFELLDEDLIEKVASENFLNLLKDQPVTDFQKTKINEISTAKNLQVDFSKFNKMQANLWIIRNQ